MVETTQRPQLGPYALVRPLGHMPLAARWLALHEVSQSSHVVYRFPICHDKSEKRRFLSAVQTVEKLPHAHLLKIEQFSLDVGGAAWVVTPFTGDVDGVLSVERLLKQKGGSMAVHEAERAVVQLLETCEYTHSRRLHHGPVTMGDVLIDRHGSLLIELYGLGRQLRGLTQGNSELERDEVRSVVEMGYQLITGLRAEEPMIPAGRLVKRLDPRWDWWFNTGLDATGGFASAREAMEALPFRSAPSEGARVMTRRSVLERLGLSRR